MLFKEIIAGYHENHMKLKNTLRGQNAALFTEGGTYVYYRGFKCW
jgi:hypothetical protein